MNKNNLIFALTICISIGLGIGMNNDIVTLHSSDKKKTNNIQYNQNKEDASVQLSNFSEKKIQEKEYPQKKNKIKNNLCKKNEKVLFSFKIAKSNNILSICISKNNPQYIVYRYGTKNKIQLEYPKNKDNSWKKFTYSYYLRGGGPANEGVDLNYLIFENEGYQYQVYQEYAADTDKTKVGVRVTNLKTHKETNIKGESKSFKGSLINLRDNKKIKIDIQ